MSRLIPHPIRIGRRAAGIVQGLALAVVLGRGVDYATGTESVTRSLGVVEAAAPLPVWGLLFLTAVATVVVGLFGDYPALMLFGHGVIACLYFGLGAGQLSAVIPVSGLDGFRTGWGLVVGGCGLHVVLAVSAFRNWSAQRVERAARE